MLRLNDVNPVMPWRDHIFGATVVLDYGQFASSWLDFNESPDNTTLYAPVTRMLTEIQSGTAESWLTPSGPDLGNLFGHGAAVFCDYHIDANARLHVHQVEPVQVIAGTGLMGSAASRLDTVTVSPWDSQR
jgi:hypothetical protein